MTRIFVGFLLALSVSVFGQDLSKNNLHITGFIDKGKVLLRWAPDNHISWQRANKAGYTLYRKTVIRNGKVIDNPDSILIGRFQPAQLDRWETYADSSTFAVAAEAIYGSGIEMTVTSQSSFFEKITIAREQQNRFSIGLLCADQSFTVACMMGLGATDLTVKTNEAYLYMVQSNYTDTLGVSEVGYVLIDFSFGNLLPRPFGVTHQVNGSVVTVTMPYEPFRGIYTNFELERSADGTNFIMVLGKDYYSMTTAEDDVQNYIANDSVKLLASTYFYRLKGRTPFDTCGPYSDTIEVKVMPSIDATPWITDIKDVDNKLVVSWAMDSIDNQNLKGFMVYESVNQDGPFKPLFKDLLDKNINFSYTQKPADYSYYRVAAIDQFSRPYFSSSRLFQAKDSIPPLPPIGLKGDFDTTGVVTLKWNYGREADLLGYQLLYSANKTDEYTLVAEDFIYDSTYTVKFPLNLLSSNLYFKTVALDTRYNTSKPSEPIMLVKPDTIPPSAPVLTLITDSLGNITASIAPSNSTDVAKHILYFEEDGKTPRELFSGTILADTSIAINSNMGKGNLYCVVLDFTGRKSISSRIPINSSESLASESFKVNYKINIDEGSVKLYWDTKGVDGTVMVYRKTEGGKYRLVGTVRAMENSYFDRFLTISTKYYYKIIFSSKEKHIDSLMELIYL